MVETPKKVGDFPAAPQGDPSQDLSKDTPPADPYLGKSAEELLTILKEKEKMIGRQTNEIGDLRTKASELEQRLNFQGQFGGQQKEPNPLDTPYGQVSEADKAQEEEIPADFYSNPKKYILQWQEERDKKRLDEFQRRDAETKLNIFRAKPVIEQAKKESPHLFQGLSDQEIDGAIYNGLMNNLVSPYSLADTKTYKQAAMWLQGEKTNYRWNPHASTGSPVPPTTTESYVGHQPPAGEESEEPIELDELSREFLKHLPKGMTEKEFLAKIREERKKR